MLKNEKTAELSPSLENSGDPPISGGADTPGATPPRRRRRGRRILLSCVAAFVLVIAALGGTLFAVGNSLANAVERVPHVFTPLNAAERPVTPAVAHGSLTFLLVGAKKPPLHSIGKSVGKNEGPTWSFMNGPNGDAIMIVRFSPDRKSAVVVSIPRDSWVTIPHHGKAKISKSFALGGPTLAVQTIERLTHIRIDHFATIDMNGFKSMTESVGGVDVTGGAADHQRRVHLRPGSEPHPGSQRARLRA